MRCGRRPSCGAARPLTEVHATVAGGTPVRGWLALPDAAADAPAPLLLWVHGGPLNSWNTWSWRWNPWLLVARGYAVLLPRPALSTGYGREFVQRGWGRWGKEPYTDLMAVTDAAEALRDRRRAHRRDGQVLRRVHGELDRRAHRSVPRDRHHAEVCGRSTSSATTDVAWYWQREMTPEMAVENSPHLYVDSIVTPMLVIPDDKDYRVPIGEALRLWYELLSESGAARRRRRHRRPPVFCISRAGTTGCSAQHTAIWYRTVGRSCPEHVLGRPVELASCWS